MKSASRKFIFISSRMGAQIGFLRFIDLRQKGQCKVILRIQDFLRIPALPDIDSDNGFSPENAESAPGNKHGVAFLFIADSNDAVFFQIRKRIQFEFFHRNFFKCHNSVSLLCSFLYPVLSDETETIHDSFPCSFSSASRQIMTASSTVHRKEP